MVHFQLLYIGYMVHKERGRMDLLLLVGILLRELRREIINNDEINVMQILRGIGKHLVNGSPV